MNKNVIILLAVVCMFAVTFQGCQTLKDITGKKGTTPTTKSGSDKTAVPAEKDKAALVKITNFKDGAKGIDPKLPLVWSVDKSVGKVKMMGINIFECGPDGKETASAVAAFKRINNADYCNLRSWTLFEKDVDANWFFQGSHKNLKQLKSNTRYLMTFTIQGDKTESIRIYLTTK